MMIPYLAQLTIRLLAGSDRLDRERWKARFLAARRPDGGFCGRTGQSDIYYTSFALRGLLLLGGLEDPSLIHGARDFVESHDPGSSGAAELIALAHCELLLHGLYGKEIGPEKRARLRKEMLRFRRRDDCFASSEKTPFSSTYQTFLTATVLEMLNLKEDLYAIPLRPIQLRQRSDGGFVELEKLTRSGTNPTAAAIGFLKLRQAEPESPDSAGRFLAKRQMHQGGFQANTLVPIPDLLSSFTAWIALGDLGMEDRCDRVALARFLAASRTSEGYRGAAWDTGEDVEYLFYGLALESLLSQAGDSP